MAYAQSTDIADRLGRDLDESESRIVDTRLEDAEALLLTRIPDLHERIESGKLNVRLVVMATADALMRLIRNPDGYRQETDGNYSYTIDATVASGRLSFLPEEWTYLGVSKPIVLLAPGIHLPSRAEGQCRCNGYNPNHSFETGISYGCPDCSGGSGSDTAVWA